MFADHEFPIGARATRLDGGFCPSVRGNAEQSPRINY
jgi:hypothetical protein